MNKPPRGNQFRKVNAHFELFKARAQDVPDMTIRIQEGLEWINGKLVEFIGGNTSQITPAETGKAKWALVAITNIGGLEITYSLDDVNPNHPPPLPDFTLPTALIFIKDTTTEITNDMIYDVRPILDSNYIKSHNIIEDRCQDDSHPISSITNLECELSNRPDIVQLNNALSKKSDITGTIAAEFTFNKDQTGSPSEDVLFWVNRGAQTNVAIRWNETTDKWEYTNDGAIWASLGVEGSIPEATKNVLGISKLSVMPDDPLFPVAIGDNDPRILNIENKSPIGHTHIAAEITNLDIDKYTKSEISGFLDAKSNIIHGHSESDIVGLNKYTKPEVDSLLNSKSPIIHVHTEADITGLDKYTKLEVDSLITTRLTDLSASPHTHLEESISDLDKYTKSEIDSLLANQITSFTCLESNIADLDKYTKSEIDNFFINNPIISHTHEESEIINLDKFTKSEITILVDAKAETVHTHTETSIEDLDKFSQSEVNGLLNAKCDKNSLRDLEFLDSAIGVIVKAPNGTKYRIKVDNGGNLITEPC